ncbi:NAD(P)H-dependent oxidoreductase [Agrilactobacillus yilanensis]|uniref:NAD(P)H-dependent oxidoreductase n=1 Tax=Agrilactobacillus yilanensis TaxID=2485997 RepID=A0ABW4J7Q1_9LACO|nr:NAD(P)H-dependent oxidoreductase [Agrilactobacillus yilanensis]
MKKIVVLVFHPNIKTSQVNRQLAQGLTQTAGVTVRYMYDLYPDGKIDVAQEQAVLSQADRVVLQFPMYWYSSPALLKQWEDDVLTYGWAYGSKGHALKDKELALAVSPGAKAENYGRSGTFGYTVTELLRPLQATSHLIGMKYVKPFLTVGASALEPAVLAQQVEKYKAYVTAPTLALLEDYE